MKERIRENLKMLEDSLDKFNKFSLQWIDKKKMRKLISVWRWYVSHGYFNEKHPKPEGIASNPPESFLDAHLQGQTTPLARDIGLCISPHISSSIMTEHAARRIMNRLNMIFHYVSPEAAEQDRQEHRDRQTKIAKDRARAAKAREDRRKKKQEELEELIATKGPKLAKDYLKAKNEQRERFKLDHEQRVEIARKQAALIQKETKQEMRDRRDGS